MLTPVEILRTAIHEHEFLANPDRAALLHTVEQSYSSSHEFPQYQPTTSRALSIVQFRCMLQDTGYPLEVYMPPSESLDESDRNDGKVDWTKLKERWVGWAVEIPGEQSWVPPSSSEADLAKLSLADDHQSSALPLPEVVYGKFPLQGKKGDYIGALIKVYDPNASFRPGTVYTFTGILSSSTLPSNDDDYTTESPSSSTPPTIPVIHVLSEPTPHSIESTATLATREQAIDYLAECFSPPDRLAAEFLLLSTVASVTSRIIGGFPLGSLGLNVLFPRSASTDSFKRVTDRLSAIIPLMIAVDLTIPLLSTHPFYPISSSQSLQSGLLQLPPSTLVLLNEDTLESGQLNDRGVKNLKALSDTMKNQKLRYEYPFTDEGFGMEVDLGFVVCGIGKSLLPVDLHVPISTSSASTPSSSSASVPSLRSFIASTRAQATHLVIPDDVAEYIQSDFVRLRKEGFGGTMHPVNGAEAIAAGTAEASSFGKRSVNEEDMKRWMRLARLMALTQPDRILTKEIWDHTLELDGERLDRLERR